MGAKKTKASGRQNTPFADALTRFMHTHPAKLAQAIAIDVLELEERNRTRIEEARKEIDDGARPRKGRFRL